MKYPNRLKEPFVVRQNVIATLVKTGAGGLVIPPPVVIPPDPEPEPEPLPSISYRPLDSNSVIVEQFKPCVGGGVHSLDLPQDNVGYGAYYQITLDGVVLNPDHESDLADSVDWDTENSKFNDGISTVVYSDWGSGSYAKISLQNNTDDVTYAHQNTPRHLVFTPKPGQLNNYVGDGGDALRAANELADITVNEDGSFEVCMVHRHTSDSDYEYRSDNISYDRWSPTARRDNSAILYCPTGELDYTVSFNGNTYNQGNLIGQQITDTDGYTVEFISISDTRVVVELTHATDTGTVMDKKLYVRLTPNVPEQEWAESTIDNEESMVAHIWSDGMIELILDTVTERNTAPDYVRPPYYNYSVETDLTTTSLSSVINSAVDKTKQRAVDAWLAWVAGTSITNPNSAFNPRTLVSVSPRLDVWDKSDPVFANYTKTAKQYRVGDGPWQNTFVYELIGDGSVLYLMESEEHLTANSLYPYDYVKTGTTLDTWLTKPEAIYHVNNRIRRVMGGFSYDDVYTELEPSYSFISNNESLSDYVDGERTTPFDLKFDIAAKTATAPGSTNHPTVAHVAGVPVISGTITNTGEVTD